MANGRAAAATTRPSPSESVVHPHVPAAAVHAERHRLPAVLEAHLRERCTGFRIPLVRVLVEDIVAADAELEVVADRVAHAEVEQGLAAPGLLDTRSEALATDRAEV